jgi:TolB protein
MERQIPMRKFTFVLVMGFFMALANSAFAMLSMELTQGVAGAVPIDIPPFVVESRTMPPQDIAVIISNDLKNSGRFKISPGNADNRVVGKIQEIGINRYQVSFQLLDVFKSPGLQQQPVRLNRNYVVSGNEFRSLAHHISDAIYQQITGTRGVFSTRLAYIVVQRSPSGTAHYTLEVADQDGYNPKALLTSINPIMSPAWSPDSRQIAYVSFEKHHAAIYSEEVSTGKRQLISEFSGINGAPAWSPTGKKLALVLSKSGSPNIYLMDLATRQLTQLTYDYYINTEPSWSPDGRKLIFTSNRSGSPQVYQLDIATRAVVRLTYEGRYNARPSYSPDGKHVVVLNQASGLFNVGVLDLDTGVFRLLTSSSGTDNESPSVAPNGSMILFGTLYHGHSVLGMAAIDGSVQVRLPARNGEVQDPAWSPFLS